MLVAVPLVLGAGLLVWRLLRGNPAAVTWAIAAGVVGLSVTAFLGTRAPESRGNLERRLNGLDLPFFEVSHQREAGHSWCRTSCPLVERTYTVPDVGVQSTMVTVALALAKADVLTQDDLRRVGRDAFLRVRSDRVDVEVRVDEADDHTIRAVHIRLTSHHPG